MKVILVCDWQRSVCNWERNRTSVTRFHFLFLQETFESYKTAFYGIVKPVCKGTAGGLKFFLLQASCEFRKTGKSFN
jgi:hypothetical protein